MVELAGPDPFLKTGYILILKECARKVCFLHYPMSRNTRSVGLSDPGARRLAIVFLINYIFLCCCKHVFHNEFRPDIRYKDITSLERKMNCNFFVKNVYSERGLPSNKRTFCPFMIDILMSLFPVIRL